MSAAVTLLSLKVDTQGTIYTDCGRIKNAMSQEHTITVVLGLKCVNLCISQLVCAEALEYFDLLKCQEQ